MNYAYSLATAEVIGVFLCFGVLLRIDVGISRLHKILYNTREAKPPYLLKPSTFSKPEEKARPPEPSEPFEPSYNRISGLGFKEGGHSATPPEGMPFDPDAWRGFAPPRPLPNAYRPPNPESEYVYERGRREPIPKTELVAKECCFQSMSATHMSENQKLLFIEWLMLEGRSGLHPAQGERKSLVKRALIRAHNEWHDSMKTGTNMGRPS